MAGEVAAKRREPAGPAAKRRKEASPAAKRRQRLAQGVSPGRSVVLERPALKGRQKLCRPFRACAPAQPKTQGLRPGLLSNAASRLGNKPSRPGLINHAYD